MLVLAAFRQQESPDKAAINKLLNTFMDCIVHKDSVKFYSLFHSETSSWVGVFKEKSFADERKSDPAVKDYFNSTYKKFYRSIAGDNSSEEKFYNVRIVEDGAVGVVSFDYSYYENGKKINWGQESWSLIKTSGQWKIVSVVFSLEMENINPEPALKKQDKKP